VFGLALERFDMDDGTFGMTWVGFAFDAAGKFLVTQRVRVSVHLNETRDGFSGPFHTDFAGADGTPVMLAADRGARDVLTR
jgi:hypothetical protein